MSRPEAHNGPGRIARWEILKGLPGEGPVPRQFTQKPWEEGFVVRFWTWNETEWVGNFGKGGTSFSTLFDWTEANLFIVVASGALYLLRDGSPANCIPKTASVTDVILDDEKPVLVTAEVGGKLAAYGRNGELIWTRHGVAVDVVKFKSFVNGVISMHVDDFDGTSWKIIQVSAKDGTVIG